MTKGPFFSQGPWLIDAYKAGYETYWPPGFGSSEAYKKNVRYLAPFKGTSGQRLEYLLRQNEATGCAEAGSSSVNRLNLERNLYDEARSIALTNEDMKAVEILLFGLESHQFGSMEALKRMSERRGVR